MTPERLVHGGFVEHLGVLIGVIGEYLKHIIGEEEAEHIVGGIRVDFRWKV